MTLRFPQPLDQLWNPLTPWCPVSIAASRARSAGDRFASAAASFTSGSPWSAVDDPRAAPPWSIPSPSSPWSASGAGACGGDAGEVAFRVPALSFSGSLVQTLVQTGEGVGVSPCGLSLAFGVPLLDKLGVGGSSPLSPTRCKFRRILELGYLPALGSAALKSF